jgi:hypothetical protein
MSMVKEQRDCTGKCGWVPGATTGYAPLTKEERELLLSHGYTVDKNVLGDEIARPPERSAFNTARFELHRVICGK